MGTRVVKWFNRDRGYGFISPDDGWKDVFVHSTSIAGTRQGLEEGQRVEFEVTQARRARRPPTSGQSARRSVAFVSYPLPG